jgi:hypothetical protein
VATCPICGTIFDERAYQLVIPRLGAFDSIMCAEEALRRDGRRSREELLSTLIDAVRNGRSSRPPSEAPLRPEQAD